MRLRDPLERTQARFLALTKEILWRERYWRPVPKSLERAASALLWSLAPQVARSLAHGAKARKRNHVAVDSWAEEDED